MYFHSFSAEYKEALLSCSAVCCPKKNTGNISALQNNTQFVSNPFSGDSALRSDDAAESHNSKVPPLFSFLRSSFSSEDILIFIKTHRTLYWAMQRGLSYLLPHSSLGDNWGTELRKLNWPSTHTKSATPWLVYLYASVESWLAGPRDSCNAVRNVNRVPGGAGMWAWVKRTHADTIYYRPADMVIFFLILLTV